ncbi:hypothetical protein ACJX0J_040465, partial [Zea mays]
SLHNSQQKWLSIPYAGSMICLQGLLLLEFAVLCCYLLIFRRYIGGMKHDVQAFHPFTAYSVAVLFHNNFGRNYREKRLFLYPIAWFYMSYNNNITFLIYKKKDHLQTLKINFVIPKLMNTHMNLIEQNVEKCLN